MPEGSDSDPDGLGNANAQPLMPSDFGKAAEKRKRLTGKTTVPPGATKEHNHDNEKKKETKKPATKVQDSKAKNVKRKRKKKKEKSSMKARGTTKKPAAKISEVDQAPSPAQLPDPMKNYLKFDFKNLEETQKMQKRLHSSFWHAERNRCKANGHDDAFAKTSARKAAQSAVQRWRKYISERIAQPGEDIS